LWFDLVLTGLQSIHAPIPLGGTSNHFRTKDLRELKGWDSLKNGYRTAVIQSITLEEANSEHKNWFWQRTRWIKGYIQTYFLHMRSPGSFINTWKKPHFLIFQLVIGGKITSMFINPLMWTITVCYFVFRPQIGDFVDTFTFCPAPVLYMGVFSLLLGNFLYIYYYMVGCVKHGHDELVKYVWLIPFYWLAMSVAAWVAFYQFLVKPHHWAKTKHGLHIGSKKAFSYNAVADDNPSGVKVAIEPTPASLP
jgi:cellulose synthase/poly-beta-1,6-N-acetylglucosamine synthase-like glycosyltransferase